MSQVSESAKKTNLTHEVSIVRGQIVFPGQDWPHPPDTVERLFKVPNGAGAAARKWNMTGSVWIAGRAGAIIHPGMAWPEGALASDDMVKLLSNKESLVRFRKGGIVELVKKPAGMKAVTKKVLSIRRRCGHEYSSRAVFKAEQEQEHQQRPAESRRQLKIVVDKSIVMLELDEECGIIQQLARLAAPSMKTFMVVAHTTTSAGVLKARQLSAKTLQQKHGDVLRIVKVT